MSDVFDELDNINTPEVSDKQGIVKLNFEPFLLELAARPTKIIRTPTLISFIDTLGTNKSGSNNAIGRLQFFLNAYKQEMALLTANSDKLSFVTDDHDSLTRGNTGTHAPDFKFVASNGNNYTIDAKMYGTVNSYYENWPTTNFHNADYCLTFIIKENLWLYSKKSEQYKNLYSVDELIKTDPQLLEITIPTQLQLIRFDIDLKASNDQIPLTVAYNFYIKTYKAGL